MQFSSALLVRTTVSVKELNVGEPSDNAICHVDLSESSSVRTTGGSSDLRVMLVVNCDLEPEYVDSELRVALQWIAASELGLPALYFRRSKERSIAKVGRAVKAKNRNSFHTEMK